MSLLRYKQKLLPYGNAMGGDGGGGGGGQPTQTTSYNTNIPEYAKPYVTGMLEATQKQIYNDDRTSFRPYTPYSGDVNNYFAGFSPLQQQAQYGAANMQQPGQFAIGSGVAGIGGIGSLGAGQQYAQNVTSPGTMQSYMSPYQQSVTDVAKTAAVREAQMAQQAQNLGAARQGTYGGARQTLAQAEREKNLLSNLSNIQAQGSQSAYDRALQSQQFGANLGMQGYGQAINAGSTLGQLGASQQASDIARQNQQATFGGQQQALEQRKIDQAIQNYAIQQQYPMMQLGFMSNMLRGLPLQSQTTQLYQAQPSTTQQAAGLLGAGASFFGGRKEGGTIKEYREGGIAQAYAPGGRVNQDSEAVGNIQAQLSSMEIEELRKVAATNPSEQIRQMAGELLAQKEIAAAQTQKTRMSGIAAAGGGLFDTMGMAGGGILAFAGEDDSLVEEDKNKVMSFEERLQRAAAAPKKPFQYNSLASKLSDFPSKLGQFQTTKKQEESPIFTGNTEFDLKRQAEMEEQDVQKELGVDKILAKKDTGKQGSAATEGKSSKDGTTSEAKQKTTADYLAERKTLGPQGQLGAEYEKYLTERLGKQAERSAMDERERRAKFFLEMGGDPMGMLSGARKGAIGYVTDTAAARKAQDTMEMEAQKARMELDKGRRAEDRGDVAGAQESYDKVEDRINRVRTAQIGAGSAGAAQRYTEQQIRSVMAENPGMSYTEALTRVAGAGRMENVEAQRAKVALASIDNSLGLMGKKDPRRAELEAQRTEIIKFLTPGGGIGGGQATQTAGNIPSDIQNILSKYPSR